MPPAAATYWTSPPTLQAEDKFEHDFNAHYQQQRQYQQFSSEPLPFPKMSLSECTLQREQTPVYSPFTGETSLLSNIIFSHESNKAYWLRATLQKAIYGVVCHAIVITQNQLNAWELTNMECAIKVMYWSRINSPDFCKTKENPLQEVAALQYWKDHVKTSCNGGLPLHQHVVSPIEILGDDTAIYTVMPFFKGGDMFQRLEESSDCFNEGEARYWFRQICMGLKSLHNAGICHRDLSLENVLIHGGHCQIIDLGMCLRIPAGNPAISPQGRCGKMFYMSPEIYKSTEAFDGYAVDIWSVGVMLFMMLLGSPPFEKPCESDRSFCWVTGGKLEEMLKYWGRNISPEAIDLLRGIMSVNPMDRLTLDQVLMHPWMMAETGGVAQQMSSAYTQ